MGINLRKPKVGDGCGLKGAQHLVFRNGSVAKGFKQFDCFFRGHRR
jgi:hypothetical protein